MADYDMFSSVKPVFGTAAGVALNGVASLTGSVDTVGFQSVTSIVTTATAIAYTAMTLSFEESEDGSTFTAAPADSVIFRKPATGTSQIFHAGYIGKARYVKAKAQTTLGTETGQVSVVLGHPHNAPFDQAAIEV